MARILYLTKKCSRICKPLAQYRFSTLASPLTEKEVVAALRPFYFQVHPDLFWQFPKEKEINENSLKVLNSYLETALQNLPTNPTLVTFCIRNKSSKLQNNGVSFNYVKIQLLGKDLKRTLHNILSTCQLPTEILDTLPKARKYIKQPPAVHTKTDKESTPFDARWWNEAQAAAADIEQRVRSEPDVDFRYWLNKNVNRAHQHLRACQPLREETARLSLELKEILGLKDILWNCGWGIAHIRGCLQSFRGLTLQHPSEMTVLKGRTLIFGGQTGVSFEGHIILSIEDVRNNWLEMIQSVDQFDKLLNHIPDTERALSEVLRGIVIDHRKFQPTVMVQKYEQQLGKLTSALYKHRWVHGYPSEWPRRLDKFQLVVECEAGPLMLSPTGQFIVPASCPAFLLVDFISRNMQEASSLLQQYNALKRKEFDLHGKCMSELGLSTLVKDDNITPSLMVQCCERILNESSLFGTYLRDMRLRISHYYSVLEDGEMCIPWNWKSDIS